MHGLKPYDEKTLDDALSIVDERFGESSCQQARLILRNPQRLVCSSAGDVAYDENGPVGFQAAILRKGLVNGRTFHCVVGGMLAMKVDASPVLLVSLMKNTIKPRGESELFLANTSIPTSMKMNRLLGVNAQGCPSCGLVRFAVFKWGSFARFCMHGKLPVWIAALGDYFGLLFRPLFWRCQRSNSTPLRLMAFQGEVFDRFWKDYTDTAEGVVLSRTAEELAWIFSDGLANGRNVLLVRRDSERILGYIVLGSKDTAKTRWMVLDWIAIGNDKAVLSDLLRDATIYLRRNNAVFLESIGFRMDYQDVIHRHLQFTRKAPNNSTIYKAFSDEVAAEMKTADLRGWFFGPYDGDRCMA